VSVYAPSPRPFPDRLPELSYPDADGVRRVRPSARIRWKNREIYISKALIGEPVGVTQVAEGQWQVTFGPLVLGIWTEGTKLLVPAHKCRRHEDTTTTTTTLETAR
jgi:hypothetical protein